MTQSNDNSSKDAPSEDVEIGVAVRAARTRLGWTRETLAHHSGVSWSAIAQIESGRRKDVRIGTLIALAKALEVTLEYLVGRSSAQPLIRHRLLVYGSEEELVNSAAPFLAEGVRRSDFVLVVTTAPNGALLRDALGPDARDIVFADASGWYRSPGHALGAYRQILDEHCRPGARWARILGEPTWTQQSRAELIGWARYEAVINFVWASYPATVVCAYGTGTAPDDGMRYARQTHPELCSAAGEVRPNPQCSDPQDFMLNMP